MRRITPVLLFLFCFLALPSTAMANGIFAHQNTFVPENETVSDVVVIGGDAAIAGTVSSSVIVINGNAHILSSAHIHGFVLVIGGRLQQDVGAEITDDVINISLDNATVNSLIIGGGLILGIGFVQLAGTLLMIGIPVLMTLIGRRRMALFINGFRDVSRGKLLYAGFFSGLLLFGTAMLLLLTIIGIPLILVVGLILFAAMVCGLTVLSQLLGEQFQGTAGKADWIRSAVGAFILAAAVNIPFVGLLIWLAIMILSLGIATTWMASKIRKNKQN